jgi:hypothetical protein
MIATLWGQPLFTIRHKYCPFAYLVRAEVDSVVETSTTYRTVSTLEVLVELEAHPAAPLDDSELLCH